MKALRCHPDQTSRLPMSWGAEGWIGAGWRAGGCSRQRVCPLARPEELVLWAKPQPAHASLWRWEELGWKKPRGPSSHRVTAEKKNNYTKSLCCSAHGRLVWNPAPYIHTPLLQTTTPAFTFPLFSTDKEQVSAPAPKSCPIPIRPSPPLPVPAPRAEPSSVPTLSSC